MFNFAEINELCEKYFISERGIFNAVLMTLKKHYPQKNIHFFDIDRQLVCHISNGKFKYFKPSNRDFTAIKKALFKHLGLHKRRILSENPQMVKKAFLENLGSVYIRASILRIEEGQVLFCLSQGKTAVGNLDIRVPIMSFFDDDKLAVGFNFLLKIKNVRVGKGFFLLECTRKCNSIIKQEISEIANVIKKRILSNERARKVFDESDFAYRIVGVNIPNKEVRVELETGNSAFMVTVAKIVKYRLGFDVKWRLKK